jgi:hypothetical protein
MTLSEVMLFVATVVGMTAAFVMIYRGVSEGAPILLESSAVVGPATTEPNLTGPLQWKLRQSAQ